MRRWAGRGDGESGPGPPRVHPWAERAEAVRHYQVETADIWPASSGRCIRSVSSSIAGDHNVPLHAELRLLAAFELPDLPMRYESAELCKSLIPTWWTRRYWTQVVHVLRQQSPVPNCASRKSTRDYGAMRSSDLAARLTTAASAPEAHISARRNGPLFFFSFFLFFSFFFFFCFFFAVLYVVFFRRRATQPGACASRHLQQFGRVVKGTSTRWCVHGQQHTSVYSFEQLGASADSCIAYGARRVNEPLIAGSRPRPQETPTP